MSMINLDFSNVASREPLEPGWYTARVEEVVEKESSQGNPMIALTYVIIGDAEGNPVAGTRKIFDNLVLVPKALWKVKQVFNALNLETDSVLEIDVNDLIGMELGIKIIQEMYNDTLRNYARDYKTLDAMADI